MPIITICCSPALFPAYQNPDAVAVVVDVLRATSSICTAFANGVRKVIPVATTEEALLYQKKGYLVAAERNAKKCDFADFGNSPFEYTEEKVSGKDLVFTTTNGTKAVKIAEQNNDNIILGAFLNLSAVANYCLEKKKDILILCSGWNDAINLEDTLFAGALAGELTGCRQNYRPAGDAAVLAIDSWSRYKDSLYDFLRKGEHFERLVKNDQEKDIMYCLQKNIFNFVPQLKLGSFSI